MQLMQVMGKKVREKDRQTGTKTDSHKEAGEREGEIVLERNREKGVEDNV